MYAKVFAQIFDSSLRQKWQALVTFVALLALADENDEVDMTLDALQARTGFPGSIISEGIAFLEQPDEHSRSEEEGGRRIVRLDDHRPWGWRIVNRGKYKRIRDNVERRDYFRQQKAGKRAEAIACPPESTTVHQSPPQAVGSRQYTDRVLEPKTVQQAPAVLAGLPVPVIELPLRDGSLHPIYPFQISRWEKAFPDVLVMDTLREQLVWLESNPSRQKTKRGVLRFVTSWLNREQNTPKEATNGAQASRPFDNRR